MKRLSFKKYKETALEVGPAKNEGADDSGQTP